MFTVYCNYENIMCQGFCLNMLLKFLFHIMFPQAQELYNTLLGQADYNATLPMILSEWHNLYNKSLQFGVFLESLPSKLGEAYWMNWMPDNSTHDVTGTLQQRSCQMLIISSGFYCSVLFDIIIDYSLSYALIYCCFVINSLNVLQFKPIKCI